MTRRFVGALLLDAVLLLGGATPASAAPAPTPPAATPPAPAECLSPNMVCVYEYGTWVVDVRPPRPVDDGVGAPNPLPMLLAAFAAFALFLGAVNLAGRLRRRARAARTG